MLVHFAHANGIPSEAYSPLFDLLNPHQIIAKSKFGHDSHYSYSHNWAYLADELIDYLDLNAKQPVVAVGHSMGALVSFIAACKKPELFKGLLMLDPPLIFGKGSWVFRFAKLTGQIDKITPAGKSKHRRQQWPDRQAAIDYFSSKKLFQFEEKCFKAFCDCVVEENKDGSVQLAYKVDVEVGIFRNTPHNLKRYNPSVELPVKVVFGTQSDASKAQFIVPFCRYFDIPYETISGEHMYPLQQPEFTAELIHQFINDLK